MLKHLVISAVIVMASWSVATASHAGFSINLPGFGMHLPLPGASVNIGLPIVASPGHHSYHGGARHEYRDYGRNYSHGGYYGGRQSYGRPYDRDMSRHDGHGPGRYGEGNYRGYGHGR